MNVYYFHRRHDTAAVTVAQAVWDCNDANAHKALEDSMRGEPYFIPLAESAAGALREREARNTTLAFSQISSSAVASSFWISERDIGKLRWPMDNKGYLVPLIHCLERELQMERQQNEWLNLGIN